MFRSVRPLKVDVFGRGGEHTKLTFDTDRGELEAICFFKQPKDFTTAPVPGEKLDLLAQVEESWFMNRHQIRLIIVDLNR